VQEGCKIDTAIIMIPEDKNIVDEACESLYNCEEIGFLDLMFDNEHTKICKEEVEF
jgi:hypothetical protein